VHKCGRKAARLVSLAHAQNARVRVREQRTLLLQESVVETLDEMRVLYARPSTHLSKIEQWRTPFARVRSRDP